MKKCIAATVVILLVVTGCATVGVEVQYDEDVDFSQYKTYRIQRPNIRQGPQQKVVNNPFFAKEVLQEIKPIMKAKGFTEAKQVQQADLLVIFYAHTQNQVNWVPGTYRTGKWGRVWQTSPGHTVRYKTGTLVIDIVDRAEKELIWQGVGEGVLGRNDPTGKLVEAVEKILEKFPPL
jgi:hypothetical protein